MVMTPDKRQPAMDDRDPTAIPPQPDPTPIPILNEPLWLMPAVDALIALIAFLIAYWVRYDLQIFRAVESLFLVPFSNYLGYTVLYVLWLPITYASSGLYRKVRGRSLFAELAIITNGVTNGVVLLMALSFMVQARGFSRLMLVYVAVITILLLLITRMTRQWAYGALRRRGIGVQRTLVVGMGEVGQAVLRVMLARRELGYFPVGYLDDDPAVGSVDRGRLRGLGAVENLSSVIRTHKVGMVVLTLPWTEHHRIMQIVETCRRANVGVRVVPDVFQLNLRQVNFENLDGIPLLGVQLEPSIYAANRLLKRLLDLAIIAAAAPFWVPVFGLVALAIKAEDKDGEVLFKQGRVGENGKRFHMYKFRSMIPDADKYRHLLVKQHNQDPRFPKFKDDPRITRVGKFIRRTSLDELPNLINVIRGEMSLVGPRPPTPDEVALYDAWHFQRLKTIPGITGMWQISGRSDIPFEEVVLLDIYYIENWSIGLDVEILLRTVPRVLLRDGAY